MSKHHLDNIVIGGHVVRVIDPTGNSVDVWRDSCGPWFCMKCENSKNKICEHIVKAMCIAQTGFER